MASSKVHKQLSTTPFQELSLTSKRDHIPLEISGYKPLDLERRNAVAAKLYPENQELNEDQRDAVKHAMGQLLIIACAGAGKTRVTITKIAEYILAGVPASEILATTFTSKAAGEMKERLEDVFDGAIRRLPTVGTMHLSLIHI